MAVCHYALESHKESASFHVRNDHFESAQTILFFCLKPYKILRWAVSLTYLSILKEGFTPNF